MKQTKEQREFNNYTRKGPPAHEWEQDHLLGEGGGVFTDELQAYKRFAKIDPETASWFHEFNKSWYGMGGWDSKDQEDRDRRSSRRKDVFAKCSRASFEAAITELETKKDVQT